MLYPANIERNHGPVLQPVPSAAGARRYPAPLPTLALREDPLDHRGGQADIETLKAQIVTLRAVREGSLHDTRICGRASDRGGALWTTGRYFIIVNSLPTGLGATEDRT